MRDMVRLTIVRNPGSYSNFSTLCEAIIDAEWKARLCDTMCRSAQ